MKIVLVGNQNCGKTSLFNVLTKEHQKVGNWPGVTVCKRSGIIEGSSDELTDLPGLYSMYAYSEEEKITREYLLKEEIDLIINVIDVTSIERSLYLTMQLRSLDIPLIVVFNMIDLLGKEGIEIDFKKLEKELGVKVVGVSSLKRMGIETLKEVIKGSYRKDKIYCFDKVIEDRIEKISERYSKHSYFYSLEFLEEDGFDEVIASERYAYIEKVMGSCFKKEKKKSVSDRLDEVFLNRWLAIPIFVLVMFMVFYLSIEIGGCFSNKIGDYFINGCRQSVRFFLDSVGVSSWLVSLVVDGVIQGVGFVLLFVPQLMILFFLMAILEMSGYMSRIAFFLDMLFKKVGLSGKTIVPFIVGCGCSVPAIMATRIIENKKERERAIILTPFIPCSAKLPIIILFSSYFFSNYFALVCVSFYVLAVLIILALAFVFKKYLDNEEDTTYISELPKYKIPSFKYVCRETLEKTFSFINRAGSIIFVSSIVIWFLLSFSLHFEYGVKVEDSILASIGKSIAWFFYPFLGRTSWEAAISSLQGLIAKEQVVSSLSIIGNIKNLFNPVSAYAFVAFNLFSIPCMGSVSAMKREFVSSKKVLLVMGVELLVAWLIATFIYMISILIGG